MILVSQDCLIAHAMSNDKYKYTHIHITIQIYIFAYIYIYIYKLTNKLRKEYNENDILEQSNAIIEICYQASEKRDWINFCT